MAQLFANNAVGVLNGSIGPTATSIALVSGAVFPVPSGGEYFMATLIGLDGEGRENAWEIVKVIGNSLDILTVERAQEGTVAGTWGSGTTIELRVTGLAFDNKVSKSEVIDSVESTATDVPLSANQGTVLKGMIDSINGLLSSDDVTLDQLQEIVDYIKTNRTDIDALGITSIAGLQTALDSKVDDSQVLTDVPAGAIFTDTTYTVGDGGLTEVNYTSVLNTKLAGIEAGANNYSHPATHSIAEVAGLQAALDGKSDSHSHPYASDAHNHDAAYLGISATAADASKLGNVAAASYARRDASYTQTGHVTHNDNVYLYFGTGSDARFWCNGSDMYTDLLAGIGNWYIRDGSTIRFTFDDAGHFTATGNVTAYSDGRLKKDWEHLPDNFLARLAALTSGTYTRTDTEERQAGVVAQELEEFLPEVIVTAEDEMQTKSVAYGNAALVACVELAKEVQYLKEKLHDLTK